jgi:hypothetical protein
MKITRMLFLAILANFLWFGISFGQADPDRQAVEKAILHYVDGLYEADPAQIEMGVHPELAKRGFWRPEDEQAYADMSPMTYEELKELAAKWNAEGWLPEDAPKEITIFEVQDKTATAKLTAQWGTDYFHLAKIEGQWKIVNVLWQSPTPPSN